MFGDQAKPYLEFQSNLCVWADPGIYFLTDSDGTLGFSRTSASGRTPVDSVLDLVPGVDTPTCFSRTSASGRTPVRTGRQSGDVRKRSFSRTSASGRTPVTGRGLQATSTNTFQSHLCVWADPSFFVEFRLENGEQFWFQSHLCVWADPSLWAASVTSRARS